MATFRRRERGRPSRVLYLPEMATYSLELWVLLGLDLASRKMQFFRSFVHLESGQHSVTFLSTAGVYKASTTKIPLTRVPSLSTWVTANFEVPTCFT